MVLTRANLASMSRNELEDLIININDNFMKKLDSLEKEIKLSNKRYEKVIAELSISKMLLTNFNRD